MRVSVKKNDQRAGSPAGRRVTASAECDAGERFSSWVTQLQEATNVRGSQHARQPSEEIRGVRAECSALRNPAHSRNRSSDLSLAESSVKIDTFCKLCTVLQGAFSCGRRGESTIYGWVGIFCCAMRRAGTLKDYFPDGFRFRTI